MQYGHCVVNATASASNSLYFTGIAPAAIAALSKAQNAFIPSGALASINLSLPRFFMSYMFIPPFNFEFSFDAKIFDRSTKVRIQSLELVSLEVGMEILRRLLMATPLRTFTFPRE